MGSFANFYLGKKLLQVQGGGVVAEWYKALLEREKINEKPKDPRFTLRPGHSLKSNHVSLNHLVNITLV